MFRDPDGAAFGVLAAEGGDPPDTPVEEGDVFWLDLFAPDPAKAAAFYAALAGYKAAHRARDQERGRRGSHQPNAYGYRVQRANPVEDHQRHEKHEKDSGHDPRQDQGQHERGAQEFPVLVHPAKDHRVDRGVSMGGKRHDYLKRKYREQHERDLQSGPEVFPAEAPQESAQRYHPGAPHAVEDHEDTDSDERHCTFDNTIPTFGMI